MRPDPTRLRRRLLAALGLGALAPGCFLFPYRCPDPAVRVYGGTLTLADGETECPASPDLEALDFSADTGATGTGETGASDTGPEDTGSGSDAPPGDCGDPSLVSQDGATCTYEVSCEWWTCCGYGRPFLDEEGDPVVSDAIERGDWCAAAPPDAPLAPEDREALAAFWLHNAAAEHSSVAGFHRFALDLLAHGAPPELVLEAGRAAAQEIRHALDAYALAGRYAGRALGPAPLPVRFQAPIARSLAELAAWTVRDGAIGETLAAWLAEESLARATDPAVREVLEVVVADETAHAELAWRTLAWAIEVGGDEVRDAIALAFTALAPDRSAEGATSSAQVAHGLLPSHVRRAAVERCADEVLRPVLSALLARDRAA